MKAWMRGFALAVAISALLGTTASSFADDTAPAGRVTFYKDVLPILQENCQTCHRPSAPNNQGMIAPMAFMSFAEVRPWAKAISKQVAERNMPPWDAAPMHNGQFLNERTLTDGEIATIVKWVATGSTPGNAADSPEPVVWADNGTGWQIGLPDLIAEMPEPYFVKDDVQDQYITFRTNLTKDQLSEPRYIKAAEIKYGSEAVHHVISSLGGGAPGTGVLLTPEGFGRLLKPEAEVRFQMHYHKESGPGTGVWDRTSVGLAFYDEDVVIKYTRGGGPGNIGSTRFEIPPGSADWMVGGAHTYEQDTYILSYMPHMHLRGKSMKFTAFYPDGTTEILLDVPGYDFTWQTRYYYKEPKMIPEGTRLEVEAHFNNSEAQGSFANFNADRPVGYGGPTTDEMMFGWISTYLLADSEESTQ